MKRLLIDMTQPILVQCDNPNCCHVIPNPSGNPYEETRQFINVPCPECGENLLTQEDYNSAIKLYRLIDWTNKWFSWITYIFPSGKGRVGDIHVHNGKTDITINN